MYCDDPSLAHLVIWIFLKFGCTSKSGAFEKSKYMLHSKPFEKHFWWSGARKSALSKAMGDCATYRPLFKAWGYQVKTMVSSFYWLTRLFTLCLLVTKDWHFHPANFITGRFICERTASQYNTDNSNCL